jgi:hypothetical protein
MLTKIGTLLFLVLFQAGVGLLILKLATQSSSIHHPLASRPASVALRAGLILT